MRPLSRRPLAGLLTDVVLLVSLLPIRPAQATSCEQAGCHKTLAHSRVVHASAMKGKCVECHPALPAAKNTSAARDQRPAHPGGRFAVPLPSARFCLRCHEAVATELTRKNVHRPVAKVSCGFCHLPHSSPRPKLLRETAANRGKSFCILCHGEKPFKQPVVHKPFADGKCTTCHRTHAAEAPALLVRPREAFCGRCHKLPWLKQPFLHGPVAGGFCAGCHEPHTARHPKLLVAPLKQLCVTCHEASELQRHEKLPGGKGPCLSCHEPHAASNRNLLRKTP